MTEKKLINQMRDRFEASPEYQDLQREFDFMQSLAPQDLFEYRRQKDPEMSSLIETLVERALDSVAIKNSLIQQMTHMSLSEIEAVLWEGEVISCMKRLYTSKVVPFSAWESLAPDEREQHMQELATRVVKAAETEGFALEGLGSTELVNIQEEFKNWIAQPFALAILSLSGHPTIGKLQQRMLEWKRRL